MTQHQENYDYQYSESECYQPPVVPPFTAQEQLYRTSNVSELPICNEMPQHQAQEEQQRYNGNFPPFFSLKCHGAKAAIELRPSITQSNWHTVMLEGANAFGERKFNWQEKTAVQITKAELLPLIAVLIGLRESCEGRAHGQQKNKGFKVKWQKSSRDNTMNVFVSLNEGNKPMKGVPISAYDALMLGHMAISQYLNNMPQLTPESLIESLKTIHRHNID